MVIRADERVSQVLARDERLIEVFVAASPAFVRLRNPRLRKVMTRLVTVEQAARIAGIDPAALVERLNRALTGEPEATAPADDAEPELQPPAHAPEREPPPQLALVPRERVVELDVREELRAGREPFTRIMAARRALGPENVLRLRTLFEPVPLYGVMARQGLAHWTERLDEEDWCIWFFPAPEECEVEPAAPGETGEEDTVEVLDVRGLEPPEPMVRTLAALEQLPPGRTLLQINVRVPRFLLPRLEELGFTYEVAERGEELVHVRIRRAG